MATKLEELAAEFIEVQKKLKPLEARSEELKKELRAAAAKKDPNLKAAAYSLRIPTSTGELVTVTSTDPDPAPPLNAEAFLDRVGMIVFHKVCKMKTVDFDVDSWKELVAEEQVSPLDLMECLGDTPSPRAWSVSAKVKADI